MSSNVPAGADFCPYAPWNMPEAEERECDVTVTYIDDTGGDATRGVTVRAYGEDDIPRAVCDALGVEPCRILDIRLPFNRRVMF